MAEETFDRRFVEESEPLSSPCSTRSEPGFDIGATPVICTLKDGSSTEQVPAVRANHPTVGIAVFPLSRIELGDVWFGRSKTDR